MHQMLGFLVLLFLTLVYSHDVLCNYLVSDWTWRCNSRLKAVYLRLEVIHCCCVKLCNYTTFLNLNFLFLLFTVLSMLCTFFFFLAQDCTVYDMEEKILDVVSILLFQYYFFYTQSYLFLSLNCAIHYNCAQLIMHYYYYKRLFL